MADKGYVVGSGNVFADLGHAKPEEALAKAVLANKIAEIIELPAHPYFVACQFHPEFTSTPRDGHALFTGFIRAALEYQVAAAGKDS